MAIQSADIESDLTVECPRCGNQETQRFYGPCSNCREQLRAKLGSEATQRESAEYEPKMNVTPNAVALKD